MAGESPTVALEYPSGLGISHRRLMAEMAGVVVVATIAGLVYGGVRFGGGVIFGGVLAFLNYLWLTRVIAGIFEKAVAGGQARFLSLRYILRYVVIGAILLAVYCSDVVPVAAVILGLAAFAFAVVFDGIASIFRRNI